MGSPKAKRKTRNKASQQKYSLSLIVSILLNIALMGAIIIPYAINQQKSAIEKIDEADMIACDEKLIDEAMVELEAEDYGLKNPTEKAQRKAWMEYNCGLEDTLKYHQQGLDEYLESKGLPKFNN